MGFMKKFKFKRGDLVMYRGYLMSVDSTISEVYCDIGDYNLLVGTDFTYLSRPPFGVREEDLRKATDKDIVAFLDHHLEEHYRQARLEERKKIDEIDANQNGLFSVSQLGNGYSYMAPVSIVASCEVEG